ncbi:MAG: nitrogenase component 1 [Elusimicrobiota bacterium]|jgi:nitrogenase molybdenum-iron protein alpha/beta subunit
MPKVREPRREKKPSKLGVRLNIPFLQGAYLAFNAIPDAVFLGDGPSCVFAKAEQIHGRHDLFSTLLSCDCGHRIQYTGVNVFTIAGNFEAGIMAAMKRMAARPDCGVFFMGSMPMCSIAGTDYERLMREALEGSSKPAFLLPRRSAVYGDWLDGYATVLETLASDMDLSGARPEPGKVAVVGHLMDRTEGDHRGSVRELERMLLGVGIEPVSVWLSGRPYEHLRAARRASSVVSLPHGRAAGRVLARRLKVPLVEADLPFGLDASAEFVTAVAGALGQAKAGRVFAEAELRQAEKLLGQGVREAFQGRSFAFCGDPHYAWGFNRQARALGGRVKSILVIGGAHHLDDSRRRELASLPKTAFEPMTADVEAGWCREDDVDLVVSNTMALKYTLGVRGAWLEFGFQSAYTHFLKDEPFLGFRGALAFLGRCANEVRRGRWQGLRPASDD